MINSMKENVCVCVGAGRGEGGVWCCSRSWGVMITVGRGRRVQAGEEPQRLEVAHFVQRAKLYGVWE